jgi:hypothetical protein
MFGRWKRPTPTRYFRSNKPTDRVWVVFNPAGQVMTRHKSQDAAIRMVRKLVKGCGSGAPRYTIKYDASFTNKP